MNGSAETGRFPLDNHIAEEEGEDEGAEKSSGRVWERGKVPWVEELKLNQAKKSSGLSSATSAGAAAASTIQSPPEHVERKPTKTKPEPSELQIFSVLLTYCSRRYSDKTREIALLSPYLLAVLTIWHHGLLYRRPPHYKYGNIVWGPKTWLKVGCFSVQNFFLMLYIIIISLLPS